MELLWRNYTRSNALYATGSINYKDFDAKYLKPADVPKRLRAYSLYFPEG